jgi:hypothetical protein
MYTSTPPLSLHGMFYGELYLYVFKLTWLYQPIKILIFFMKRNTVPVYCKHCSISAKESETSVAKVTFGLKFVSLTPEYRHAFTLP